MKKFLVFENQFEDICEYFKNKGFDDAYPKKRPTDWPCVVLVDEKENIYGVDYVEYHYVYASDFNWYKEDVD